MKRRKKEGESFSDTVDRLTDERSLLDPVGLLAEDDVDEIEAELADRYEGYGRTLRREWGDGA
ncbi:antitoxin VapB family protein [Halegenticoccus soli]|uniref:antitoxin VapB family protein n=1 Tax=Halegenticoccus soli TaxID=1985678 RepID=UPI001E43FFFD|nr:antitoxin VapB family protein [Halegenticoccus soli]